MLGNVRTARAATMAYVAHLELTRDDEHVGPINDAWDHLGTGMYRCALLHRGSGVTYKVPMSHDGCRQNRLEAEAAPRLRSEAPPGLYIPECRVLQTAHRAAPFVLDVLAVETLIPDADATRAAARSPYDDWDDILTPYGDYEHLTSTYAFLHRWARDRLGNDMHRNNFYPSGGRWVIVDFGYHQGTPTR